MQIATARPFGRRAEFWAAMALGPVVWGIVWLWQGGGDLSWPLRAPGRYILLSVVYPLLEEIVFRGGLQGAFTARVWGRSQWGPVTAANLMTSILFACAHVVTRGDVTALAVFFPSLIFGYFRDRDNTWISAAILHGWYNMGYLLLFYATK
ncbi:MAG: JDVT-CTERM system glutamic-type intramembrane protease [Pseudomonadota bacterium]